MSTDALSTLQTEIDKLAAIASALSRDAARSGSSLGHDRVEQLGMITARLGPLIRRLYGPDSQYEQSLRRIVNGKYFTTMHSNCFEHVSELAGIAQGIQLDLKAGMLKDLRKLVQADVFADFLDMAEHLLGEGYKDASAVLIGAVLEDSLRKLASGAGVSLTAPNGRLLTIDPLNVALAKAGTYGPLVQKQITTWANLRNDAAHGQFSKYDDHDVRQMLVFVQKFCSDYLQ